MNTWEGIEDVNLLPTKDRLRKTVRRLACLVLLFSLVGCSDDGSKGWMDTTAPRVLRTDPEDGTGDVSVATHIKVIFSEPLSPSSVHDQMCELSMDQDRVPLHVSLLSDGTTLIANPTVDLEYGERYVFTIGGGYSDRSGIAFEISFSTPANAGVSPVVNFDPYSGNPLVPYPSNICTMEDGSSLTGRRLNIDHALIPRMIDPYDLNSLDGFSYASRILVSLSSGIDKSTLPQSPEESILAVSSLFLVNMDRKSEHRGEQFPVLVTMDNLGLRTEPISHTLIVRPLRPLDPGTTYALVITRQVSAPGPVPLESSPVFEEIKNRPASGSRVGDTVSDQILPVLRFLEDQERELPLYPQDIAVAFPFTTQSTQTVIHDLLKIRDALELEAELAPPAISLDPPNAERPGPDIPQENIAAVITGTFPSPDFRNEDGVLDEELFAEVPVPAPRSDLRFLLTLPESALEGPAPVIVFLHGIDDSKERMYDAADTLAYHGFACIGIDLVEHGSRFSGGLIPWMNFLRVDDIRRGRDNFRQSVSDEMQLVQVIKSSLSTLDLLPLDQPDGMRELDTSQVLLIGNSLGGLVGTILFSLESHLRTGALFVTSGNLTDLVLNNLYLQPDNPVFELATFLLSFLRVSPLDVLLLLNLAQEILSVADLTSYAPHVVCKPVDGSGKPKNVLLLQALQDEAMTDPNIGNLARALGIPLLGPVKREIPAMEVETTPVRANLALGATGGTFQFDTVNGGETATHVNLLGSEEGLRQVTTFFNTYIEGVGATIIDPYR